MLEYLKKTYKENHELGYEKIYIAVDIHGTILGIKLRTLHT